MKEPLHTNLEKSETFNKTVLESSPDCLKLLDIEGRLQFMNFNGLCHMEIDNFEDFKGAYWWNLWGTENEMLVRSSVEKALKGESVDFSAFCNTAKGTPKWWDVTISPVKTSEGVIEQLISVSRDITEQKKAEDKIKELNTLLEEKVKIRTEELLAKNIELERINTELSMFNNIASHDLQEPLRKIQMFSKLIVENEAVKIESNNHFKKIIESADRMRNLIDSLQKYSVSKNAEVVYESCDLNVILAEVTDYFHFQIEDKKAVITYGLLPTIQGSKILITQLIINLFENALKYAKANIPPHITVTTEVVSSENITTNTSKIYDAYYAIKVADNGIGFDNTHKHKIFDLFKRLHAKDEFTGTGTGLTICKTIAQKYNGWMDADSTVGEGSVFTLYIPKKV